MSVKMERIGDIFKLLSNSDNEIKPKRMTFDLSEDGKFYYTKLYVDIIDKNINKKYDGYIECQSNIDFVKNFNIIYDHDSRDAEIFTITIPDME